MLKLLELLQDRPSSTGAELARELDTDPRTLRRDITALRDLGIPIEGERGRGGSYRIAPGFRVPPLMFTPDEVAAVALGLIAAQRLGIEAMPALTKVKRVLPERLKHGVEALEETLGFTDELDASPPSGETLLTLADAARRGRALTITYTNTQGETADRDVSPWGVVSHRGRWYVAAWDHEHNTPRTLRADRIQRPRNSVPSYAPAPPDYDAIGFVSRSLASVPWQHTVVVFLDTDAETAATHFPPTLAELRPTEDGTVLVMRADSLDWAAGVLASSGIAFTVKEPEELRDSLNRLAQRLLSA